MADQGGRGPKAGFVEEGRLRESVLHDGRWYDEVLMSILDHEWAARRSAGRTGAEPDRRHVLGLPKSY